MLAPRIGSQLKASKNRGSLGRFAIKIIRDGTFGAVKACIPTTLSQLEELEAAGSGWVVVPSLHRSIMSGHASLQFLSIIFICFPFLEVQDTVTEKNHASVGFGKMSN